MLLQKLDALCLHAAPPYEYLFWIWMAHALRPGHSCFGETRLTPKTSDRDGWIADLTGLVWAVIGYRGSHAAREQDKIERRSARSANEK
jgi:hypothetical protein